MDFKVIEDEIDRIRKNCEELNKVIRHNNNTIEYEKEKIDKLWEEKRSKYKKNVGNMVNKYREYYNQIVKFETVLSLDSKTNCSNTTVKINRNFGENSLEKNLKIADEFCKEFNKFIANLNEMDFDSIDKPHRFRRHENIIVDANDEDFKPLNGEDNPSYKDVDPLENIRESYINIKNKAESLFNIIEIQLERKLSLEKFKNDFDEIKNTYLTNLKKSLDADYDKLLNEYFIDEKKKVTKKEFFEKIDAYRSETNVSAEYGSNEFMESVLIGELSLDVASNNSKYFKYGTVYPTYMKDGWLDIPLVWDFVNKGNILIDTKSESYSQELIAFVRQLILEFVSSFPAKRTKIKLIDLDNKMDFSVLSRLGNADQDILDGGIVRTESNLSTTIQDYYGYMFKIKDDLLSYNMVKNIFEFNKRFKANPQSVYLFVFANFPYCLRDDTIKKVYDIVKNGNDSGLFSIIINNNNYSSNQGLSREVYNKVLSDIGNNSIVIKENNGKFSVDFKFKNTFIPRSDFRIDDLQIIIDRLKDSAKKSTQIIISIDEMFEAIDKDRDDDIPSIRLNIPIGKRGGDIQYLSFDASSTNTHALAIGSTGSGKSVLLHTIILNACYKYSPEDLNLYIIDFKGGVEFKYYESKENSSLILPHIRLTGLTNDVEDGLAILKNLENILNERENIFTSVGCQNIYEYCRKVQKMPRLLVIIDEIQTLFDENESIAYKAIKIMDKILTKGRAFGICILWASQGVPRTPGSNKLLSETGNKICLKLQNPQDSASINVDPKMVAQLGQIEKGLAVINETPNIANSKSFRVAYSENTENRFKYSKMIVNKWKNVISSNKFEPLFVVGDEAQPVFTNRNITFNFTPTESDIKSYAFGKYDVVFGENYVTGKPYANSINLRENGENILIVGNQIETVRDIMGFSLLSVMCNHMLNLEAKENSGKVYLINGELINPKNENALINLVRKDFENELIISNSNDKIQSIVKDIYIKYKDRYKESSTSEYAIKYAPIFIVIHSIQRYYELFEENPLLKFNEDNSNEKDAPISDTSLLEDAFSNAGFFKNKLDNLGLSGSGSQGSLNNVYFVDALAELMERGGSYGIHFIVSGDKPTDLKRMKDPFRKFEYKIITKGLRSDYIAELISDYRNADTVNKLNVCWVNYKDNKDKVKYYQFNYEKDKNWYENVKNYFLELR